MDAATLNLIRAAQAGDVSARNRLIEQNMGLIVLATRKACNRTGRGSDWRAFVSYAVEAFAQCLLRFDPSRGFKLSAYTVNSMVMRVRDAAIQDTPIRVPTNHSTRPNGKHGAKANLARHAVSTNKIRDRIDRESAAAFDAVDVREAFGLLPPETQGIIRERLDGASLTSIGKAHGKSKEWARLRLEKGYADLRARMA